MWAFMYSLDGLLAEEGTPYWDFCFGLPVDPADTEEKLDLYRSAHAHLMGRTTYEAMSASIPDAGHPFSAVLDAGRKIVFSRTLASADWPGTTIVSGDTREEVDRLRDGDDGPLVVWGGVGLWRSLIQLDLVDELRLDVQPYVAGEGTRLFDGTPKDYRLDLVSSTTFSHGRVTLRYRRR